MRLLADSHVLVWWLDDPLRLAEPARTTLADPDNVVFLSAASIWELTLKMAKGKLRIPEGFIDALLEDGFGELAVSVAHVRRSAELPPLHQDPFDRLLVAQSLVEGLLLVTRDEAIAQYAVPTLPA